MEKGINDKELEAILEEEIKKDDNESAFQLLRPVFGYRKKIPYDKLSSSNIDDNNIDLMPALLSIDQSFCPWIRTKLKERQARYFDKRLKDYENSGGQNNIEKAFIS